MFIFFSLLLCLIVISINFQPFCFICHLSGSITWNELFHILLWHILAGWQLNLRHYESNLLFFILCLRRIFKKHLTVTTPFTSGQQYDKNRRLHTQFLFHMLEAIFILFVYKNGFHTPEYTNLPLEIDPFNMTANKNIFKQIQFHFCAFFCFAYKTDHNSFDFRTATQHTGGA